MLGHQQQPNDPTSDHQPQSMNFGYQLNGTIPHDEPNGILRTIVHSPDGILPTIEHSPDGILPTILHSPNGDNYQFEQEEANLQHQRSQSVSQSRTLLPLQPAPQTEDDVLLKGIRVPVAANVAPHVFFPSIRDCPVTGCRCRIPDLRSFLGEHDVWQIDCQVFRALWEPEGLEGLNGTYLLFSINAAKDNKRPLLQRNNHFSARLQGDVFILKVKEPIDGRAIFADPLGFPTITLPHQSGVHGARYQHIDPNFLGSDLYTEMTLAATSADTRYHNPSSTRFATPVGFWRAVVQQRLRTTNYQVPPVTPTMGLIMAHFWPPHRGPFPLCIDPELPAKVQEILPGPVSKST